MQSGITCRLPRTPRSEYMMRRAEWWRAYSFLSAPRSVSMHYFDVSPLTAFFKRMLTVPSIL